MINRPGVALAVSQSPPSLLNSVSDPLVKISSKNSQSQTRRARDLKFFENVHPTIRVMCHMSCVTCPLSHEFFFLHFLYKLDIMVGLVGGGSVINGAYPVQFLLI